VATTTENDPIHDKPMPLLDHLIELRRRMMWAMGTLIVAFGVCYFFSHNIFDFLTRPLESVLAEKPGVNHSMIYTQLYEAFFTYIRVAFFGAAFLSFPVVAGQLWMFIAPGLYRSEKRAILPFLAATPILFVMGAALAYYFVFPFAWRFFASFEVPAGEGSTPIQLMPKVGEYLDLVMKMIFAFGIAFQLPVALALMAKVGIVSSKGLKRVRRYAYVGMFVVAAILAPPDIITQCGLAIPLILLYEISIFAAKLVEPKPAKD
jgi:sec-independent protein translocase protein TatC